MVTQITQAERKAVAKDYSGGFPWWRIGSGVVIGTLTALVASRLGSEPAVSALGGAAALFVVVAVGYGVKSAYARFIYAPRKILSDRLQDSEHENAGLRAALSRENWDLRYSMTRASIQLMWGALDTTYRDFSDGGDLQDLVSQSPWPDETTSEPDIARFAEYIYPPDRQKAKQVKESFEGPRRAVVNALDRYGRELGTVIDADGALTNWLLSEVAPTHTPTLKLVMYLRIALAERVGASANLDHLYKLRDVFMRPNQFFP